MESKQIKCLKCGICCYGDIGAFIFPCDINPISSYLNISEIDFLRIYCVKEILNTSAGKVDIYSLVKNKPHCVFLSDNLCSIYSVRPIQCKRAPFSFLATYQNWKHMPCISKEDFDGIDSTEQDKELVKQLLIGYFQWKEIE